MSPTPYSFIDVAILDGVRERFAAGDALVILSEDLEELIWANGPGALLFGLADIEAVGGAESGLSYAAKRQVMSTSGYPKIGSDRGVMVRLAKGMESRAYAFLASELTLPDGEEAILLAVPAGLPDGREAEVLESAIGGFAEPGHLAAFVDARGAIEAASPGFATLGIATQTLADMAADASRSGRRLVKRVIPTKGATLPAGMARLRDTPARHLLLVVDERAAGLAPERPVAPATVAPPEPASVGAPVAHPAAAPQGPRSAAERPAEPFSVPLGTAEASRMDAPPPSPSALGAPAPGPGAPAVDATGPAAPAVSPVVVAQPALPKQAGSAAETRAALPEATPFATNAAANTPQAPVTPAAADEPGAAAVAGEQPLMLAAAPVRSSPVAGLVEMTDDDVPPALSLQTVAPFDTQDAQDESAAADIAPAADRAASPLRFAWKTDADGRFTAMSPEFLRAVGSSTAAVIGRRFKDLSAALNLDPYGEIAGLLERRDTWSGRSVLWPIDGTDLRVPVDLAALPVYGRDRSFEGFRGFGVARLADTLVDAGARGQRPGEDRAADASDPHATPFDDASLAPDILDDPFRGEVPALSIAPVPDRRLSDKIIKLAEHRAPAPEKALSTLERSAFREIGERLRIDAPGVAAEPVDRALKSDEERPAAVAPEAAWQAAGPMEGDTENHDPAMAGQPSAADTKPDDATPDDESGTVAALPGAGAEPIAAADPIQADAQPALSDDAMNQKAPAAAAPGEPPARHGAEMPVARAAAQEAPARPVMSDAAAGDGSDDLQPVKPTTARVETPAASLAAAPPVAASLRPSSAELKIDGFLPSAFSGPATAPRKATQDTPILSRLPVPLLVHSGDVLHYANEEFLALTGYDSVEQLAQAGGLGALFAERYDDDGAQDSDDRSIRLTTRDGLEFAIEALLRSVPWNGGKALMLVVRRTGGDEEEDPAPAASARPAVSHDEVPTVDATALKARVAEMRTIIDTATDGVILIANDGTIRSISRPAEALFGFDTDDLAGKPFVSLFAIESQRAARDYLAGLSDNGVASVLNDGREVIGREAQGRFIPLFMTIGKLPGESGYCAVVRDITQWKRAEEELTQAKAVAERASSQKTDFLARVSHEIRTPLNAIIGFSELMVDERFGPIANERYRDYLRDINRSGNHVLDLVNDLLDISKIEAGEQEMAYEAVSLNDTLAETVAMMQPQANRERVIIRSSFASRLPDVVADLRSVRQIALNILSNAVRYTQAGGQVIISTSYEPSGDVVMRVRDTGIGMSSAEIEQAMKPFKQINALKRPRGDGTGLGLPLTKAMVEANRARFSLTSSPGDGTLVEVVFPATRVLAD